MSSQSQSVASHTQLVEASVLSLLFGVCLAVPFRRRWWAYLVGVSAIRLGLDFFRGDLPTCAGLSPQQLVAVGGLVTLCVIGVRNRWPAPVAETATVRE